jgi:hypothetical protein
VFTGIEADPDSFDLVLSGPKSLECRYCRKEHVWTKRDAMLVDPNRWSDLPEIDVCFTRRSKIPSEPLAERAAERDFYCEWNESGSGSPTGSLDRRARPAPRLGDPIILDPGSRPGLLARRPREKQIKGSWNDSTRFGTIHR